jgi:heme exporter protein C
VKATSPVFLVLFIGLALYGFMVPPAKGFAEPDLARIIFWHVPCAFVASWCVIWAAWCGGSYLKTRKPLWDFRLEAALELAALFSAFTLVTGIIFSRFQWGAWWHWDTRQTSFLVVVLMTSGAVALRGAFGDEAKRAASSAAYALGMVIPAIFLTFVLTRIDAFREKSLHPTGVVSQGGLDPWHRFGFWGMVAMLGVVAFTFYRMKVRVSQLEYQEIHNHELGATDCGGAASDRSVRPVPLSPRD